MPNIHILVGSGQNDYQVVLHIPTPVGKNSVGIDWSECIILSGNNISSSETRLTPEQSSAIASGTMVETTFTWTDNPNWSDDERNADLDLRAAQITTNFIDQLQSSFKYYGLVR